MKEQRGIRHETREKYSDAITLYVETGLSIKQICEQTGVGFSAFSSYLSTHHRDLILKRHNLTEFKNVKLRGKKGQTTAAHYKYKDAIDACDSMEYIEYNISQIAGTQTDRNNRQSAIWSTQVEQGRVCYCH